MKDWVILTLLGGLGLLSWGLTWMLWRVSF